MNYHHESLTIREEAMVSEMREFYVTGRIANRTSHKPGHITISREELAALLRSAGALR